jgi:DNA-binding LacI/PurR family transcriptional regulator
MEMGRISALRALALSRGEDIPESPSLLPPKLIVRASAAPHRPVVQTALATESVD